MISSVEWEAWEARNHWKCIDFDSVFMIYSVEWEAGNPESSKMHDFHTLFITVEYEAWETQNHWKCIDSHTFFMISSVELEAWEAQNHWKCRISMHFPWFLRWSGKRGQPRIIKNVGFPFILHDFFGGVGSVGSPESQKIKRSPNKFYDFFGRVGSAGGPESSKIIDFRTFFMISLVEWEAWEAPEPMKSGDRPRLFTKNTRTTPAQPTAQPIAQHLFWTQTVSRIIWSRPRVRTVLEVRGRGAAGLRT